MPGLHTVVVSNGARNPANDEGMLQALAESPESYQRIAEFPGAYFSISAPFSYPWRRMETADSLIVLDGLIYNRTADEQRRLLEEIAEEFRQGARSLKGRIASFVRDADGDFIVEVWDKASGRLLIFNDHLARLAFYYFCDGQIAVFSRELRTPLRYKPSIDIDRFCLVDVSLFQYPIGNKTLFKDVSRLEPCEILIVESSSGRLTVRKEPSLPFVFDAIEPITDPSESIRILRGAFLDSLKARVDFFRRSGHRVIADLSGGFDTRALLGGFCCLSEPVEYVSYKLVTGDESGIARQLFEGTGAQGTFTVVEAGHEYSLSDLPGLVYETDGLVNYHTTYACNADVMGLRGMVTEPAVRFCGLGGEFIRHPTRVHLGSLFEGVMKGIYSIMPVSHACRIARVKESEYVEQLKAYLETYPEKDIHDQLKRWYYEYYNHFVGAAAEDRERALFWTAHPLWSTRFTEPVFNRIPLELGGIRIFYGVHGFLGA